uniref:VP11 n=1 Tax=Strongyloides papillosus TaxID=174720 RepID=A0A0N5BX63_STREA
MMRNGSGTLDDVVDNIIYIGVNASLICAILAILGCGFTIITIVCNLLTELIITIRQYLTTWYKKKKTCFFDFRPKNVFISSSNEREVPRLDDKSLINRTPISLEGINFDSSSDMEYFSLDGDDFDEQTSLNAMSHECKTVSFYNGVKCHSTPNRINQDTDLSTPFTYVKNPIYIL